MTDPSFRFDRDGMLRALELLGGASPAEVGERSWPKLLPDVGVGEQAALDTLAPGILGGAQPLGTPLSFAHMDPPTPWITWATTMWNAALNQNLLHPATAPVGRHAEATVIDWLAPFFGMDGGHMVPGSSVANLTALWAARECAAITDVVYSDAAHLSIAKAAHILGLRSHRIPVGPTGIMLDAKLPSDMKRAALVLTAGTTSTGEVDPLALSGLAAWTHVDAAWAGPLRLSGTYAPRLAGIERADSVAVSAHKWMFQPKESALIFFRDSARAHESISFGGAYLASPNIGVLGSHGAIAVPLLATLLAWGRQGMSHRIESCMRLADEWASFIKADPRLGLLAEPRTGIVVWRPSRADQTESLNAKLPAGATSLTRIAGEPWIRNVAANPNLTLEALRPHLLEALAAH